MPTARVADPIHRFARYLSIVGHPFIALPASVAALSVLRGGDARAAAGLAALFVVVSIAVLVGIRQGRFNDFDVSERQRRSGFYAVATAGTVMLGILQRDNPGALRACLIAAAVLVVCGVLNHRTKASLHTAFALYAAGFWAAWSISAGLVALPIAAAIAWSRVRLARHTVAEVFTGAGVGLVAALSFVYWPMPLSPAGRDAPHDDAALRRVSFSGAPLAHSTSASTEYQRSPKMACPASFGCQVSLSKLVL